MVDEETITAGRTVLAVQRLINSHFHNENGAQCSIPANLDDDDIVASRYVRQSEERITALQQANQRMRKALDGLVASAITCCPEYLSLVANGKRDNETIQGWALGDWNAALDIARAALAEAGRETDAERNSA